MKRSDTPTRGAPLTPGSARRPARAKRIKPTKPPTFRDLNRAECDAILLRNNLGRLAYSFHDRVDIQPLHYIYEDNWLIGRTSHGSKLTTIQHSPWVAFEVDEVEGLFDWRSVVVHGVFDMLTEDGPPADIARWEGALEVLRRLVPAAIAPGDPAPYRTIIFRIAIDDISGREATTT